MDFMSNILPAELDRWNITNGVLSETQLLLHPGGKASCTLTTTDIAYIPKAFQIRIVHNADINWKMPGVWATLYVDYENGNTAYAVVPLNTTSVISSGNLTSNVVMLDSTTYSELSFSINNPLQEDLVLTLWELRPSLDMDDSLYNSIEGMLPQLVYAYNDTSVTTTAGVDTQIVQLPVSVNQDTNLLMHLTITGQASADTITCSVKLDGELIKSFPVKQTVNEGDFFFGVPSLLAFVQKGIHLVTVLLSASETTITVSKESALLALDGKGILGGADGAYPHAEVVQEIKLTGMHYNFAQDILLSVDDLGEVVFLENYIPPMARSFNPEIDVSLVIGGTIIEFNTLNNTAPPLTPYDTSLYYTTLDGLSSVTTRSYSYSKEVREDCIITTTHVDTTDFNPVYSTILIEEVSD